MWNEQNDLKKAQINIVFDLFEANRKRFSLATHTYTFLYIRFTMVRCQMFSNLDDYRISI